MQTISRRNFIKASALSATTICLNPMLPAFAQKKEENFLGPVSLGKTGIEVTRVAMGTGTSGWNDSSKQTRIGMNNFLDLAQHAYDQGIRFIESADTYGSHTYIREALKQIPRDKIALMTKMWSRPGSYESMDDANVAIDKFRKELGVDYIDIILLHCQVESDWPERSKRVCDQLAELKAKGVIRAHGVSCHSLDALKTASDSPWVDVILARINDTGANMDHMPEVVMPVLKKMHDAGKGVIGMKIYGGGKTKAEEQRESSLRYVWNSGNIDTMTVGFSELGHVDDTLQRVKRILAEKS